MYMWYVHVYTSTCMYVVYMYLLVAAFLVVPLLLLAPSHPVSLQQFQLQLNHLLLQPSVQALQMVHRASVHLYERDGG